MSGPVRIQEQNRTEGGDRGGRGSGRVVVVIREHAHETSTDTKASVLPVGEVVVTAGATLHGATHCRNCRVVGSEGRQTAVALLRWI